MLRNYFKIVALFFLIKSIFMRFIYFYLLFSISVFSQDFNKLDENGNKHGIWRGLHQESKRPKYEGTFKHGKEIGTFKFYDDTKAGTVIATREFNANDNSCYTIFYNQKNNKVSEGKVVDKQFEGRWIYYHEDSPAIMTEELYLNGKLNGIRKVFYKNGKLAEESEYKADIRFGFYKSYAENGIILEESTYAFGQYEGEAIYRNVENKISGQGFYKNGKKVGIWKLMEDGKLKDVNMNNQGKKFQKRVITN